MPTAYIVAAQRSAVGKAPRGKLRQVRPDDLLAHVLKATLAQCPELDQTDIADVVIGCAMPESSQGLNVARRALLLAGLPHSVPGVTVNRLCASSLQAIAWAAQQIEQGHAEIMIAGGCESMSQIPMGGLDPAVNARLFADADVAVAYGMGLTAENVAKQWHISREQQDEYALQSHQRALDCRTSGGFDSEINPYSITHTSVDNHAQKLVTQHTELREDEGPRLNCSAAGLAKLSPAFAARGSVTAGNSSQMSDGAAAVILMSEAAMQRSKLSPLGRFVGYSVAGVDPAIMGIGPIVAIPKVLKQTGIQLDDLAHIELNEAFAAQTLAVIQDLKLNTELVNPHGGAIALGHPLGASGAIRTTTLLHAMVAKQKQAYGMVTMCIGTGMGAAGIFEALH